MSILRIPYETGEVTNGIYTREGQQILIRSQAVPEQRNLVVETVGFPHAAIREDAPMKLAALDQLSRCFENLDFLCHTGKKM